MRPLVRHVVSVVASAASRLAGPAHVWLPKQMVDPQPESHQRLEMIRSLSSRALLLFVVTLAASSTMSDIQPTRTEFERLAGQLPYLSLDSVLYDRPTPYFQVADRSKSEAHFRILTTVTDGTHSKEALLDLLSHSDPKVRTLAAVALFDQEDPSTLSALVELAEDDAPTFDGVLDGHAKLSRPWLGLSATGPPPLKQTVGDIAKKMVGFYMERSGFHYGVVHKTQPGFAAYWDARKNRPHCAGWFAVQLARASQGISPTQKNCINRIRAVRRRIDQLPADQRAWVLLWLYKENGSDVLATEEELIEAGKKLGAKKLLLMLQNKIPSDDPDLQPRARNNWPYQRMSLFILRHADQLLRSRDSDSLLACERWQRNYQQHGIGDPTITPWWAIAAARLKPENASAILHAAMRRFQGQSDSDERSALCVAMWQLTGRSNMDFLVDWFYEDAPERGAFPHSRGAFIEAMGKDANGREILSRLLQDPRLAALDWQSLERLVRVINAWIETPLVTEEEIRNVRHPFGQGHYHWSQLEAELAYPKETAELRKHLARWRERLRLSIPKLLCKDMQCEKETGEPGTPAGERQQVGAEQNARPGKPTPDWGPHG